MAKMFYTGSEAAEKLGITEDDVKGLARDGKLREFRDAGSVRYKVSDVDAVAATSVAVGGAVDASASASGELVLEPADDSTIELATSGSDIISLEETDLSDSSSGTTELGKLKEDTVVPSVGVNVFDDDELDEDVDPLAQTAISDLAGLGLEGVGSGSGILDLARESDDTSLGKELLDEIYSDDSDAGGTGVPMGDATRAGLEDGIPAEEDGAGTAAGLSGGFEQDAEVASAPQTQTATRQVMVTEFAPDAGAKGLTAFMAVGVAVMMVAGLGAAAMMRGITPGVFETIYESLWIFALGAVVVAAGAGLITYFVTKRSK